MATDHRRVEVELVQEVLLDDPGFLKEIVQRVVQELLEAEMTELDRPQYINVRRFASMLQQRA